jgi:cysteinyl-tRNA synthetase
VKVSSDSREGLLSIEAKFLAGMDDDCNTAIAIACLFDLIHLANTDLTNGEVHHLGSILSVFEKISGILFLFQNPPCVVTLNCKVTTDAERRVQGLLNERVSAREGKNWELADALRDEVLGLYSGMNLEDTPSGPVASFWF